MENFAVLHTVNVGLSTGFSLVQLLVFARAFDTQRYAEVVLLTTLGLLLMPLSAAGGRANYTALREDAVRKTGFRAWPATLLLLRSEFVLLNLLSLTPLLLAGEHGLGRALENMVFLNFCLMGNFCLNDVQPTAWAIDLRPRYIYILLGRTLITYLALPLVWTPGGFLAFSIVAALTNYGTLALLARFLRRHTELTLRIPPGAITVGVVLTHAKRLWTSLLAGFSEVIVMTAPYPLLIAAYGIGPALITFDVMMKMARVAGAFARVLSEVSLPRITKHLHLGANAIAWRSYLLVLATCGAGAGVFAGALLLSGDLAFSVLLGPNDVLPSGAEQATAAVVCIAALFQPALYIIAFTQARGLTSKLTLVAAVGCVAFAGLTAMQPPLMTTIWGYVAFFLVTTLVAIALSRRAMFRTAAA